MKDTFKIVKEYKIVAASLLIIGLIAGSLIGKYFLRATTQNQDCLSDLHFINPGLNCTTADIKGTNLTNLENKINVLVSSYTNTDKANRVSVFVRDLDSKRFLSINDNETFDMASLLKLPLVIGGFKLAEVEPLILNQEITYTGTLDLNQEQEYKPEIKLETGQKYTVKELMKRAIDYSDNNAAQMLFDYYPKEFMDRIMQALGISISRPNGEKENLITARALSGVFRTLYNSAYLTREYSNETLSILTQTAYKGGMVSIVPKGTVVAHKFAERTQGNNDGIGTKYRQLHDCGIVYANNGKESFIYCIMTEGSDFSNLEKIQTEIASEIYQTMINSGSN